jgi:hypothetical protein
MSSQAKQTRILMKTDTTLNWEKAKNFIPMPGEICIYSDGISTNTFNEDGSQIRIPGIKVGDGSTLIKNLPFINGMEAIPFEKINEICGSTLIPGEEVEF